MVDLSRFNKSAVDSRNTMTKESITMKLIKESSQKIDKLRQYKKDKSMTILHSTPWLLYRHAKLIGAVEDDNRKITVTYQVALCR